jgi:Putative coat protein
MEHSIEQFKEFVKKHPKLRNQVREGNQTWQSIYEEWVLLGDDDNAWVDYVDDGSSSTSSSSSTSLSSQDNQEFLKSALGYVKKINPDDITKYINNAQKVLGLLQMFNGGGNKTQNQQQNMRPRRNIDPLFRRFDDYDD